jgi:hypothetical protein
VAVSLLRVAWGSLGFILYFELFLLFARRVEGEGRRLPEDGDVKLVYLANRSKRE